MKKIMFNDKYGLTEAVLQGRKTMMRRMVSVPEYWHGMWVWGFAFDEQSHSLRLYDANEGSMEDPETGECAYIFPKYKIGEVVAVAQSYQTILDTVFGEDQQWKYGYMRDVEESHEKMWKDIKGRTNKMFVRADLMLHQIEITDIKVERLQNISDEDCLKEGIQEYFPYIDRDPNDKVRTFRYFKDGKIRHCISPASKCFAYLIDDISGYGIWERNPWVFVYSFEKIK